MGNRVYVSDVQEGIQFVKYKAQENQLTLYADETMPRYIIDYSSHQCVIGASLSEPHTSRLNVIFSIYIYIYICLVGIYRNSSY